MAQFPQSPSPSSNLLISSLSDRNPVSSFSSPLPNDGSSHQPCHTLGIPEVLQPPFILDDCLITEASSSADPFSTNLSAAETVQNVRIAAIPEPAGIVIEKCKTNKRTGGSSLSQGDCRKQLIDSPFCADALISKKPFVADDINYNKGRFQTKVGNKVIQAVKKNDSKSVQGQAERKSNLKKDDEDEEGVCNSPTRYRKQKGYAVSTPSFSSFLSTSTPTSSKSNSASSLYSPLPHGPKYSERRSYRPSAPISSGIEHESTSLSLHPKIPCNSSIKDKKSEARIVSQKGFFFSSNRSPSYSRSRSRSRSKSKSKSRSRSRSRSISLSPFHSFSLSSSSSLTTSSTSTGPSSPRSSRSPIFRSRTSESRADTHRDTSSREYHRTSATSSSSKSHYSLRKDKRRHHRHPQHSSHRSRHASDSYHYYHRQYPKYKSTPSVSRDYRGGQYRYNRLRQYSSYRPGSPSPSSSSRHRNYSNASSIPTSSLSVNPIGFDISSSSPSVSFSATSNVEVLTDYTSKAASFRNANFIHTANSNASKKRYSSPSGKVGSFSKKRLRKTSISWSRSRSSSKSSSKSRSFSRSVSPRPRSLSRSRSRSHSSRSQASSPAPPSRISGSSRKVSLGSSLWTKNSVMATFCSATNSNSAIPNSTFSGEVLHDRSLSSSPNSTPSVEAAYEALVQVGEGTYGKVFKARDVERKLVALKRIRIEKEKEGFPITALREIKLLQSLSHPNVVHLLDLAVDREAVYMVFEYMHHDLAGLLQHPTLRFQPFHIRYFMNQLFQGLSFLHSKGIVHRDLKGSNLLLNQRGELKLADFGLARHISRNSVILTNRVITLWYRPIELLLGSTHYSTSIDVWSAGCILLEFFLHKPAFPGVDELHQVDTVVGICGTLSPDIWPDCVQLPWYHLFSSPPKPRVLREVYHELVPALALDLVDKLLQLNPNSRPTAQQVLEHPYFLEDMQSPIQLLASLKHEDWHEFESKRRNKKTHSSSPLPRPLSHGSLVSMLVYAKKNVKSMVLSPSSLIHQSTHPPIPPHQTPFSKSALVQGFVELVS